MWQISIGEGRTSRLGQHGGDCFQLWNHVLVVCESAFNIDPQISEPILSFRTDLNIPRAGQ